MSRHEVIRVSPVKPPSRISRVMGALRSLTLGPWNPRDPALARYFGGGGSVTSGVSVTERNALDDSAVWAAVALISDDVASLPLVVYKTLPNGGKDKFEEHKLYELLHDQPNPEMTSFTWRRTMQAHLSLYQNAYSEIERDAAGRPVAIWPLIPETMTKFRQQGAVFYRHQNPGGGDVILPDADVIHLVGHASDDGSVGGSLVAHARESLALGVAAKRFGGSFFGNGATFGGVIAYKGPKPPELSDRNYTDALQARHQGVERAHKLLALYNDATFTRLGVDPNAAQFLETRVFQIREVARYFKLPPHKLADLADATFSNVEQQNIEYFTSCLRPLLIQWEQELSRKLISRLERKIQSISHVTQGLLQADAAGRSALYQSEFNVASITPNEVRGFEGLDPRPEGDRTYIQLGYIPADRMDEWIDAEIAAKTWHQNTDASPSNNVDPNPSAQDGGAAAEIKALREALDLSRQVAQTAEDLRDLATATSAADLAREVEAHAGTRAALGQVRDAMVICEAQIADRDEQIRQAHATNTALDLRVADADRGFAAISADLIAEQQAHATTRARDLETAHALAFEIEQRQTADRDRDAALSCVTHAEQERDAARMQAIAFQEAAATAERTVIETQAQHAALASSAATLTTERDTLAGELATVTTELAQARADIATELERQRSQRATLLAAMRSLFVDATERLLAKESNAARKQQATADKLRTWVDRFYPLHVDTARDVFRPLVGPWTAITGGAPDVLLDRLVAEHVSVSANALRLVTEADGDDERAMALERTLSRWESERADAMADALVREGMGNHG